MKQCKKLTAFFLAFAMILSLAGSIGAKAATSMTVTLYVAQDSKVMIKPVTVTLTDADKKDFGVDLATDKLTPLHALAKYYQTVKNVSDADMKNYITPAKGAISAIKLDPKDSGSASASGLDSVYWMWAENGNNVMVNEEETANKGYQWQYTSYDYPLQDKDTVTFYGLWSPYPANDPTFLSSFDKDSYTATAGSDVAVTVNGKGTEYDASFNSISYTAAVSGASVTAYDSTNDQAVASAVTDAKGKASIRFEKEGTYYLTSSRLAPDKKHYDASVAYASVTVTKKASDAGNSNKGNTTTQPGNTNKNNNVTVTNPDSSAKKTTSTVKKPGKVTKVSCKVKASKKKKKSVTVKWAKTKNAKKYKVYLSKKQKKGYKAVKTTTKTKTVLKLKKGTYFVKVKAVNKTKSGSFSKVCKVRVK